MKKLRWILSIAFLIAGVAGGLYVGGYLLLFKSILTACIALDAGQITAAIIWTTIVKAFLSVIREIPEVGEKTLAIAERITKRISGEG